MWRRHASSPGSSISRNSRPPRRPRAATRDAGEHRSAGAASGARRRLGGTGAAALRALKGLIGGSVALGGPEQRVTPALRVLERELAAQILPDGGHLTRNPSVQLQVIARSDRHRGMLRAAQLDAPAVLTQTIEAMAPICGFPPRRPPASRCSTARSRKTPCWSISS
jgi:hypothetical protein